jgi:multidrug efflux pump subunit AcrB
MELAGKLVERLRASNKLTDLSANPESTPQPQICLDIDRTAAQDRGVAKDDLLKTLQVYFGSLDVNDFNRFGRTWQVTVQAKPELRMQIEDIKQLKVRNVNGEMVPLSAFVALRETEAAAAIHRLDFQPMVEITANPVSSLSLAQARTLCENLAEEVRKELRLSAEYRLTWLQEMPAAK